jgi:hypothetical protein
MADVFKANYELRGRLRLERNKLANEIIEAHSWNPTTFRQLWLRHAYPMRK